jgi:hypothetical protein
MPFAFSEVETVFSTEAIRYEAFEEHAGQRSTSSLPYHRNLLGNSLHSE